MRVLVVGGAGFFGSHVVDRLLGDGHTVDVVDDLSAGSLANLGEARSLAAPGQLKFHHLDVQADELDELRGPARLRSWCICTSPAGPVKLGEVGIGGTASQPARRLPPQRCREGRHIPGRHLYATCPH
ncbi:MAG: NAD-dependent epimerase/dehydratase family protein [Ilumatobacteraceae bacterium]